MSDHQPWTENLRYHVEVMTDENHIEEVVARVNDLSIARAVFDLVVVQHPLKLIMLCQKARILRRSDRPT